MNGSEPDAREDQRRERAQLGACHAEVVSARSRLQDARRNGTSDLEPLRARLVAALERYAATIQRSGAPLPQRLHAELQLHRGIPRRR